MDDARLYSLCLDARLYGTTAGALGRGKLVFGNMLISNAVITIGKKKIKIGADVGDKEPDGPKLDLAPSKYKLVLQVAGKAGPERGRGGQG